MKHQTFGRDTVVLLTMAFGFGALFAWGLAANDNSATTSLGASEWAAWVQALGSIIGIAVAIAVPFTISRQDRLRQDRERRLTARSYALLLLPRVELLVAKLNSVAILLQGPNRDERRQAKSMLREACDPGDWVLQLHNLGDAGGAFQDALAAGARLLALVGEHEDFFLFSGHFVDENGEVVQFDPPPDLRPLVEKAQQAAEDAASAVRGMFG